MFDFNRILNWKLLAGSHVFPGPDGGTCVNEAAIVAAGFAYRAIGTAEDCPPCFSRPLAAFALSLNDRISNDALRQALLMPFVTRLAGSADEDAIEEQRAAHIVGAIVRRILRSAFEARGLLDLARACSSATTIEQTRIVAATAVEAIEKKVFSHPETSRLFDDPLMLVCDALRDLVHDPAWSQPMLRAGDLVNYAGMILDETCEPQSAGGMKTAFAVAAAILAEALDIGKQAEPVAEETLVSRFETAKKTGKAAKELAVVRS
jgi:hypothetical protein